MNTGAQRSVETAAFRVMPPTPLVEIAYHVPCVYGEQFFIVVRTGTMVVDYGFGRIVDGFVVAVYTACEVYIFGIHEETLIKEPDTA